MISSFILKISVELTSLNHLPRVAKAGPMMDQLLDDVRRRKRLSRIVIGFPKNQSPRSPTTSLRIEDTDTVCTMNESTFHTKYMHLKE
jgi:hypothetical protein